MSRKNHSAAEISNDRPATAHMGKPEVSFLGAAPDTGLVTYRRLVDDIAKSKMVIRNIAFPKAQESFPFDRTYQTIGQYFPLAEGGPLYVDEVQSAQDEEAAKIKVRLMKEQKLRYLVIRKDTDMIDAMRQLGS